MGKLRTISRSQIPQEELPKGMNFKLGIEENNGLAGKLKECIPSKDGI